MKLTLLDMVQSILSAMDSDEVSDIADTVEAEQVAMIVRETFFELMDTGREWPFLRARFTLDSPSDVNTPTVMIMPDNCDKVYWIRYKGKQLTYLEPADFQELLDRRVGSSNAETNGVINDRDPIYWTTFNDKEVIFDAWDSSISNTMLTNDFNVYGVKVAEWEHTNSFVPDMPDKMFPTLLAAAKSASFVNIKQQANPYQERVAQRGRVAMRNEAWRAEDGEAKYNRKVNYGRR